MGCLIELFIGILFDGTIELIGWCYIKLMTLIVPNKTISDRTRNILKCAVYSFMYPCNRIDCRLDFVSAG